MNNWLQYLIRATAILPVVVAGVQQLHNNETGATKKDLAMGYLGLATLAAQEVLNPEEATQATAVSQFVSLTIDNLVQTMHTANAPGFGQNSVNPTWPSPQPAKVTVTEHQP